MELSARKFDLTPPNNKKFKSSVFWMNQTILIIFVFFMKKTFIFSEKSYGNRVVQFQTFWTPKGPSSLETLEQFPSLTIIMM